MKDEKGSPKPRRKRENGSETFSFLMSRAETESDYKKEELRLKARTTYRPKAGNGKSTFNAYSMERSQQGNVWTFPAIKRITTTTKAVNNDGLMNFQRQETQLFNALREKLKVH